MNGILRISVKNFLLSFCIFILLCSPYFYPNWILNMVQLFSMAIILMFFLISSTRNKGPLAYLSNKYVYIIFIVYLLFLYISSYINRNNHELTNSIANAVSYIAQLIVLSIGLFTACQNEHRKWDVLQSLIFFFGIACVLNDILFFPHIEEYKITQAYLFSGKFSVSYMHIEWLAFYILGRNLNIDQKSVYKIKITILFIYSLLICMLVDCSTGIVGLVLLCLFLWIIPNKVIFNPFIWVISLVSSTSFVIFYDQLLKIGWVKYIIVDVLKRSETLTGRTFIYQNIPLILNDKYTWGYGFNSDYETWRKFGFRIPNAQNGAIHLIIEQGSIALILLICFSFLVLHYCKSYKKTLPIVTMVYVLTFLGSVEITFTLNFVALFLIIYFWSNVSVEKGAITYDTYVEHNTSNI